MALTGSQFIDGVIAGTKTITGYFADGITGVLVALRMAATEFYCTGDVTARHYVGNTAAPSVAMDANAGMGATGSMTGHDSAGFIQLATGTGATTGIQAVATFASAYGGVPKAILLTPKNQAAINLAATVNKNINVSAWDASTFTLSTIGPTPLDSSTTYQWWYKVEG